MSGVGIFCSNLLRLRKPFPPVSCHLVQIMLPPSPEDPFQVQTMFATGDDESEDLETEERLNKRLQIERYGNHLMIISFECDLRQFRNVDERDPIHGNSKNNYTLLCIRRENLSDFWSQETSTVSVNSRRSRIWTLRVEKGSGRISYSGIRCGRLPPGTKMHGKREKDLWKQGPSIR